MSKEIGPRERALREMREARFARKGPNPFEDVARCREPAPKENAGATASPVVREGIKAREMRRQKPAVKSGSISADKGQEAREQAPSLERGSTPLLSTNSKRGRPKKGEKRDKPWEAAGISKASWYRQNKSELARK